ncbi:MAG TPA: hypothetical protein PK776_13145 [Flavobacterium sp.]|nr:hypothetical protein [Flavobacterium sp.]
MNNVIAFLKNLSPLKMVIISVVLGILAIFLEKPFPGIFLALRLTSFVLLIVAIIRYFNKK